MSGVDDPRDGDFEEANSKLNEGLKSCRAVADSYRALLSSVQKGDGIGVEGDTGEFDGTIDRPGDG